MKRNRRILSILILALTAAILVSALCVSVLAIKLDYSSPAATHKETLSSADILELATGLELTQAERDYLGLFGGESITYSPLIPSSNVTSEYLPEKEELKIIAKEYVYTAPHGFEMRWTPRTVKVGENSAELEPSADGKYIATLTSITDSGAEHANVIYTTSLTIAPSTVNALINLAYTDAPLWQKYQNYLSDVEEFDTALALYQKYVVDKNLYDDNLVAYRRYLSELAEYEIAAALYEAYLGELAIYNAKYAEYLKYLDDKKVYDTNLALYNQYVENIGKVRDQLAIIDGIKKVSTSLTRSVYTDILSGSVDQVLAERDAIANPTTGLDPAVVIDAEIATIKLRELFDGYFGLTAEVDKYAYYSINYKAFRDSFTLLFQALDKLYENPVVRIAIREMDKTQKFEILLAELFYTVNAFSDTPVRNYDGTATYNSSYRIQDKKPITILEGDVYMPDKNNATPITTGYPTEVAKPTLTVVECPVKPAVVANPIKPAEVKNPGEPPAVVERPTRPTEVKAPHALENARLLPPEVLALIELYAAEGLAERAPVSSSAAITLEATATKKFLNIDEIFITFHNENGEVLDSINAERTSYVEFSGATPTKPENDEATYTFVGWQDENGNPVDMTSVDCPGTSLLLYPRFQTNYKLYRVLWYANGELYHSSNERLGAIPTAPEAPTKADAGSFMYTFKGWDKTVAPTSSDESQNIYNATFERGYIVPFKNGSGASVSFDGRGYTVDCAATVDKSINLSYLLPRAAKTGPITVKTNTYTVEIPHSEVISMSNAGVASLSVFSVRKGSNSYTFGIYFLDSAGKPVTTPASASLTMPYAFSDTDNTSVYYEADGKRVPVRANHTAATVTITAQSGITYYTVTEYAIDKLTMDKVTLEVKSTTAAPGDKVQIRYSAPLGVIIKSVYYLRDDGTRVEISGASFVMPESNILIGVEYRLLTYTVTFMADGRVINSATYAYGEQPLVPTPPAKASDDKYSYEFVEWDTPVSSVMMDKTYTAVYKATELPPREEPEGLVISDSLKAILAKILFIAAYALAIVLPVAIIALAKLVARRKRRVKKPRET